MLIGLILHAPLYRLLKKHCPWVAQRFNAAIRPFSSGRAFKPLRCQGECSSSLYSPFASSGEEHDKIILQLMSWTDSSPRSSLGPFCWTTRIAMTLVVFVLALPSSTSAQELARRLILKDGSYQSVTKYELKDDRVRYLS